MAISNDFLCFLFQTYEAYTAAVASAAVDLDSETDSNHDTALTLACAGGHEELVTLLINRGANIGKFFGFFLLHDKVEKFKLLKLRDNVLVHFSEIQSRYFKKNYGVEI